MRLTPEEQGFVDWAKASIDEQVAYDRLRVTVDFDLHLARSLVELVEHLTQEQDPCVVCEAPHCEICDTARGSTRCLHCERKDAFTPPNFCKFCGRSMTAGKERDDAAD